uniref:Uncharacterized protein n=1 Tax=Ananas comosus var. bracteatus TaxID=296719 RepID=A0A6V7QF81_ANACO|nr:unnamed protein product [Ananas comosus var. bracteatus]
MATATTAETATTTTKTALSKIERAHQMYREGRHEEALGLYTEALAMAKTKAQKIALHSNRAACYLKLHDFKKAAEECTAVLELDYEHTGALMLRAQTLVTLKDYQSALFDVNRLIELNPSSEVYRNLHARLKTQLSLAPIPESDEEMLYLEEDKEEEEEEAASSKVNKNDESSIIKSVSPVTKAPKPESFTNKIPAKPKADSTITKSVPSVTQALKLESSTNKYLQNQMVGRQYQSRKGTQGLITRDGTRLKMILVKRKMMM